MLTGRVGTFPAQARGLAQSCWLFLLFCTPSCPVLREASEAWPCRAGLHRENDLGASVSTVSQTRVYK